MGAAPLAPLSLQASGMWGLNLQNSSVILDPKWCTRADNMVFDATNRLTTRNGWSVLNSTPMSGSPTVSQIFEYNPTSGSNVVISTGGNNIYTGTTTLSSIKGSLTITADNWKFVNFNGNTYGLQTGHSLIQYTGTGNATAVTAATGTVPTGNELLSAFGRLWGSDSTGQVIKYSQLLDATNWSVTGAGSINVTSIWGNGNDSIVALAQFNSLLIVFGSRNIIIFQDGTGSVLGLDPVNIAVSDMIPGIGCIARDSVQNCNGEDLVFLSASGVQSLKRVIIERSNATRNISLNVRDYLNATIGAETPAGIRSTYNAHLGVYLLLGPVSQIVLAFDTKQVLEDGTWRVTQWNNFIPTALYTLHDSTTLYSGKAGQLFQYLGLTDPSGAFLATYESGWLDLGPEVSNRQKVLKRVASIFASSGTGQVTYKWAFDFNDTFTSYQVTLPSTASTSQFGSAQFAADQWGGGFQQWDIKVPGSGTGQFMKVGLAITASSCQFSLNQMQLYAKVGRLV